MKFTTFLTILAVIGGIYWCVLFAPVLYIDHWEVKDKVNEVFNAYRLNPNPEVARQTLQVRLGTLRFMTHKELNNMGEEIDVPGPPTTAQNPKVDYDDVRKVLMIRYEYDRVIKLVPTDKIRVVHMAYERREDPFK